MVSREMEKEAKECTQWSRDGLQLHSLVHISCFICGISFFCQTLAEIQGLTHQETSGA